MIMMSVPAQEAGSARSARGTPRKVASGPYIPPSRAILSSRRPTIAPARQGADHGPGQRVTVTMGAGRPASYAAGVDYEQLVRDTWDALSRGDMAPLENALAPNAKWRAVQDGPWNCGNRAAI